jgi:RNA recognition motif-containing protein
VKILRKPIRLMHIVNQSNRIKEANCFVKNLDPALTNKEFEDYFKEFGTVISSQIRTNENGESLHYGYVQFEKVEEAQKCIAECNGK